MTKEQPQHSRLTEYVILALYVMQPPACIVRKKNPQTTVMKACQDVEGNRTPAHRKGLDGSGDDQANGNVYLPVYREQKVQN
jgi:hypothetical protein